MTDINEALPSQVLYTRHTEAPPLRRAPPAFLVLMAIATALMASVVWPFRIPLFIAAVLATALQPLFLRTERLLRGRRYMAGLIITFLLLLLIVAPFASIVAFTIREVVDGLAWVRDSLGIDSLRDFSLTDLPENIDKPLHEVINYLHISPPELQAYMGRAVSFVQSMTPSVVGFSLGAVTDGILVLLSFFFLTVDGRLLVRFLVNISPLLPAQTQELLIEFRNVSSAALLGTVVTALLQAVVILAGFWVAGVPKPVFFGLITIIAAFVPVVGTAVVWVPAAVGLAIVSHWGAAIGLTIWCAVCIAIADHVIKPMVLGGKVEMHGALVFLSLLGGLAVFGLVGIIAGPLIVAFFLALVRMYNRDFRAHPVIAP